MDMRSDHERRCRSRYETKEVRLPGYANLTRKNAPENGALEDTDHQCRAQRDQRVIHEAARDEETEPAEDEP